MPFTLRESLCINLNINKFDDSLNFFSCRLVYKWFLFIYKLSYVLGIISYSIMLATIVGLNIVFEVKAEKWIDCSILLLFYGVYFGVLGRDIAEICADKMASHIGVCIN